MIKFAVIIPDRGDRPKFLAHCIELILKQTIQPDHVELVNYKPLSEKKDITQRYRIGYDNLRGKGFDVIFFIENDDFYKSNYFETMITEWVKAGKPNLFGTRYTYYYHIKLFAYFKMQHIERCSAMSTMIKPDLNFNWCVDEQPYTDTHLWSVAQIENKVTFLPDSILCLGIKHGIGITGGDCHANRLERFKINKGQVDVNKEFLRSVCDNPSFNFYNNYFTDEQKDKQI